MAAATEVSGGTRRRAHGRGGATEHDRLDRAWRAGRAVALVLLVVWPAIAVAGLVVGGVRTLAVSLPGGLLGALGAMYVVEGALRRVEPRSGAVAATSAGS